MGFTYQYKNVNKQNVNFVKMVNYSKAHFLRTVSEKRLSGKRNMILKIKIRDGKMKME